MDMGKTEVVLRDESFEKLDLQPGEGLLLFEDILDLMTRQWEIYKN